MDDKLGIAMSLDNLGIVAMAHGDYTAARTLYEEALALLREMGDKFWIPSSLGRLGSLAFLEGDYAEARELCGESLVLCKEMDDKSNLAYNLLGLGLVDIAEGKPEARENIIYSLRLLQELGVQHPQTSSLIGAAGLVLNEGNLHFAAQLLGAVSTVLKGLNAVVEPRLKPFQEGTLAKVKAALGDEGFQSAWEEGSQWSLEEAVKKVLGE